VEMYLSASSYAGSTPGAIGGFQEVDDDEEDAVEDEAREDVDVEAYACEDTTEKCRAAAALARRCIMDTAPLAIVKIWCAVFREEVVVALPSPAKPNVTRT
jgi:hypothetical protein